MNKLEFTPNLEPTLGVELELGLVDERSMALSSSIQPLLDCLPPELRANVKPELMQCYVEINSGVHRTVAGAEADLRAKVLTLQRIGDDLNLRLLWSATHPFSLWREQEVTPTERYYGLINRLQDTVRQLVTFGLHVHVGVASGERAIAVCNGLVPYLPMLLALSVNSPCWDGRLTGLQSNRCKIMEGLPGGGLPVHVGNWSEYVWLVNHLMGTGFISSIREVWWDVRPQPDLGTVEVRICDIPGSLEDTMALAALVQCLVCSLSEGADASPCNLQARRMMVRHNKWHAARYGLNASLMDFETYESTPVRELVKRTVRKLWPVAERLQCQPQLQRVLAITQGPSWADRQVRLLEEHGPEEAVRRITADSRLANPSIWNEVRRPDFPWSGWNGRPGKDLRQPSA